MTPDLALIVAWLPYIFGASVVTATVAAFFTARR